MSYDAALTHPFHPRAKGARVPDEFVFPTTVYSTTVNYTINCDSNGNADFLVLPNPFVGVAVSMTNTGKAADDSLSPVGITNGPSPTLNFGGITAGADPGSAPVIPAGTFPNVNALAANPICRPVDQVAGYTGCYCPALSSDQMRTYMSSWRVVGMGCRIRSLPSPQTQSGQFQVATVPCPDELVNPANSTFDGWLVANSFPQQEPAGASTRFLQASMIQYPASDMFMFAELTREGGLEWVSRRSGPKADQFKASSPTVAVEKVIYYAADGTTINGRQSVIQTTNVALSVPGYSGGPAGNITTYGLTPYDEYGFSCSGWSAIFGRFTGLPVPTNGIAAPVVNIEVVYHLEGQPTITSSGGLVPNVSKGIYDVTYFTACTMKSSAEPWFRRVIDYDRFSGRVVDSNAPLQVAMAGLLGSQRRTKLSSKSKGLKRRFY